MTIRQSAERVLSPTTALAFCQSQMIHVMAQYNSAQLRDCGNVHVPGVQALRPLAWRQPRVCRARDLCECRAVVLDCGSGSDLATGTPGNNWCDSPGNVRADDKIASYSTMWPRALGRVFKPDLVAPGNEIGAAALVLGRDPTFTPDTIGARLMGPVIKPRAAQVSHSRKKPPKLTKGDVDTVGARRALSPNEVWVNLRLRISGSFPRGIPI